MLHAIDKNGNQYSADKSTKQQFLYCPECQEQVILKKGKQKNAHFAHKSRKMCIGSNGKETKEHLQLKRLFFDWLQRDLANQAIYLERYLPEICQRPDILYKNLAIEIQCSRLSFERFEERTTAYLEKDYVVWWIMGSRFLRNKRFTLLEKSFCMFDVSRGLHLWQLDWKKRQLILRYDIKESILGEITCKKSIWVFYSKELPKIFNGVKKESKPRERSNQCIDKRWLQRQLYSRHPNYLRLQGVCYRYQKHLLFLSDWVYYDSSFFFYFKESVFLYRMLFEEVIDGTSQKSNYGRYLRWRQKVFEYRKNWAFPLINESAIYLLFYEECVKCSMYKTE